jgi:hypothetical protein
MRQCLAGLIIASTMLAGTSASAHKPSDSYLTVTAQEAGIVHVEWHIALRDLDTELRLDANDDGRLTWGEVRTRWPEIRQYAGSYLALSQAGQACAMQTPTDADADAQPRLASHSDGQYAVLSWIHVCAQQAGAPWRQVEVDYRLFALTDPTHRGIVHWRSVGAGGQVHEGGTVVMGIPRPRHALHFEGLHGLPAAGTSAPSPMPPQSDTSPSADTQTESILHELMRFIEDGMHHIAIGADHILFLMSLLLVSVWQRDRDQAWQARTTWQAGWQEVLKLVTAFTVAHSITLGLATFGVLSPPARWVESLIALSVLVAAMDNLLPIIPGPRWVIVFVFGLVHGFGFASALQDMALSGSTLAVPLLGFNLGVEAGQLSLVALVLPAACWMRRTRFYRLFAVNTGSALIAAMAMVWLIERMGNLTILGWGG